MPIKVGDRGTHGGTARARVEIEALGLALGEQVDRRLAPRGVERHLGHHGLGHADLFRADTTIGLGDRTHDGERCR